MKKYITLAALLSAGAAFANAGEVEQDFSFTEASSTVTLVPAIDLTKDWTIQFSMMSNPWDFATYTGATLISSSAFTITSSDEDASFTLSAGGKEGTFSDSNWPFTGLMGATTTFTFTYTAGDSKLAASVFVDGAGAATTFGLDDVQYSSGTTLDTLETGVIGLSGWTAPSGTITGTAIPEPSAFGLLAGLGALALVGTRRRRK